MHKLRMIPLTHGLCIDRKDHPLYKLWYGIQTRCYKATSPNHIRNYQSKGIKMYDEWRKSLLVFYNWCIDNGWKTGLTIDRIDSNKDYSPDNCRFISKSENSGNVSTKTRSFSYNTAIEIKKDLLSKISEYKIAKKYNIHRSAVSRFKRSKLFKEIEIVNRNINDSEMVSLS